MHLSSPDWVSNDSRCQRGRWDVVIQHWTDGPSAQAICLFEKCCRGDVHTQRGGLDPKLSLATSRLLVGM